MPLFKLRKMAFPHFTISIFEQPALLLTGYHIRENLIECLARLPELIQFLPCAGTNRDSFC